MQSLIQSLRTSQDPLKLALDITTYFENVFKSAEAMNQEQTYTYIDRIVKNISKHPHSQQDIFNNTVGRMKFLIKQTIKIFEEDLSTKKPNINSQKTLFGLFENLSLQNTESQKTQQSDNSRWIKKVTLDSISNFKQQIESYPQQLINNLRSHIRQNSKIALFLPPPSIVSVFETLKKQFDFECTLIYQTNGKVESKLFSTLPINKSSGLIKQANKIFICCNTILKNGGVVSLSGGLLIALTAHHLSNSVIGIAPSFTLSNELILDQSLCSQLDNPSAYISQNPSNNQSVCWTTITKKYDYIPPEHIAMLITDIGISTSSYAYRLIDKYNE